MYVAGDRVLYGSHGVCRVAALDTRRVDRKTVTYLVLEPLGQNGSSFLVPSENAAALAKLKPILSREELESLLSSDAVQAADWAEDGSRRKLQFREIMSSGDRLRILQMIFWLHKHKQARIAEGKKFHQTDDGFLRDAEKLVCSEICCVFGMDPQQGRAYLREKLNV